MRLLTKTTLYFLIAMVVLLTAGGFFFFRQFSREMDRQTDQELIIDEVQWIRYLKSQTEIGSTFILRTPEILVYPVDETPTEFPAISQSSGFSATQNIKVPYRQLSHVVDVNGINYQIIIRKSQEQKPVFLANITNIILLVFAAVFVKKAAAKVEKPLLEKAAVETPIIEELAAEPVTEVAMEVAPKAKTKRVTKPKVAKSE